MTSPPREKTDPLYSHPPDCPCPPCEEDRQEAWDEFCLDEKGVRDDLDFTPPFGYDLSDASLDDE